MTKWISTKKHSPDRYHSDPECSYAGDSLRKMTPDDERKSITKCRRCHGGQLASILENL